MVTAEQISKCIEVAKRYGATRLVLFGSAVYDAENARDIDLLCEGVKASRFLSMGSEMENETGIMVDTVPADAPTPFVEYNMPKGRVLYESI